MPTDTTSMGSSQVEQRSAKRAWYVAGISGLLVAGVIGWVTWKHYDLGTLDRPGPGFFPLLVAALMVIASVIALIEARGATYDVVPTNRRRFGIGAAVMLGGAGLLAVFGFLRVSLVGTTVLASLIEGKLKWEILVNMTDLVFDCLLMVDRL